MTGTRAPLGGGREGHRLVSSFKSDEPDRALGFKPPEAEGSVGPGLVQKPSPTQSQIYLVCSSIQSAKCGILRLVLLAITLRGGGRGTACLLGEALEGQSGQSRQFAIRQRGTTYPTSFQAGSFQTDTDRTLSYTTL